MVWGVCRRVLSNYYDAEDAFQATFLVLVRKAASIASPELLGNWLYGVAHQTAIKARATVAKRKRRERQMTEMPEPAGVEQNLWNDVQPLLDQELSRLPDKYRGVIVLCDLEGKTRKEVAGQLGCAEGTVASRLARARIMLAKRLTGRGIALSGGALTAVMAQQAATAGVPNSVVDSTIKAASLLAAGKAAVGAISGKVAALMEGVMKAMLFSKLKTAIAIVLILGFVATGATILTCRTAAGQDDKKPAAEKPVESAAKSSKEKKVPSAKKPESQEVDGLQAGNATKLGFIKIEARGDLVRKGADYFLVVKQNKFPTTEWLVRSNADKSAINKILLSHKDCAVVLTGDLSWLPKGAQVNSDDDYALGIVISAEAQLRRGNVFDTTAPYVKFEAQGDPWVIDNSLYVRVQLQEKPAKKVTVFGQIGNLGQLMTVLPKFQAKVAGYVTWEPRPSDEYAFRLPFIDIDKLDPPPAEAPGNKGGADKKPAAEKSVESAAKQEKEKETFTAWGKEVDGLQAGLSFRPGEKRPYTHGETVKLVVRVRNVSKKEANIKYIPAFFFDRPPSVTDGEGKAAPQLRLPTEGHEGEYNRKELTLAPGKEVELAEVRIELRPESESDKKGLKTLYGTGKFLIQYERIMYESGKYDIGSILSMLATGKLEVEIKSAPPAGKK
jgi:RNA polymerase sigma factor (sigma-70 family)